MKNLKPNFLIFAMILALIQYYFIGCKEQGVSPVQNDNIEMSVVSSADTADNSGILLLTEAKVLIKDIKLNAAGSGDSFNFKTGPYVLYLDLNTSVHLIIPAYVPPGTYDKIRFMIHKLNDNEPVPDPDFADANGRYSVVVKGSYNGISFTYKSIKSAHQKITFPVNVTVAVSAITNVTLQIKPYSWFIKNGVYLNPMDPVNINDIDNNIKDNINNNIRAFKDDNKDGLPD